MRKVLYASAIATLLLTACAAPQGKTTVSRVIDSSEPTEFVLTVNTDREKETPTVKKSSVEEDKESSISPFIIAHMINNGLPRTTAKKYASYILKASETYHVDPFTILSIIHVETGGTFRFANHPNSHGAIGLMQILRTNSDWMGVQEKDLYDPKTNIMLGTQYLSYLQNRFGHDLGIIAYNQGEGNVERGTYRTWYLKKVQSVFESIEGNDYMTKYSEFD